ncbi:MAG: xanthine dehydrogenase accessory protein XdhC, partial [Janthinobacterium sp.]
CLAPRAHLTLFGAGHVGAAIVRALGHLPCNITWVDEREDMFPAQLPGNVCIAATDTPEEFVAMAPPGGSFLVMTHSHALDQRLTQAIMEREDGGWFGLIGSDTKRKQFEHRLRARGVPDERIAAMVCPIGMPGIRNKAPAVIAASVACQLLMVWEETAAAALAAPLRLASASAPPRREPRAAIHPL